MTASAVQLPDVGPYQRWRVKIGKYAGEVLCLPGMEEDALAELTQDLAYWKPDA